MSKRTPPTFLFHTVDDPAVPVENSMVYAQALRRAGVPFEMHLYEHGQHGVGLATADHADPVLCTWTDRLRDWLKRQNFIA
ncbi:MAG: alpha/beta hydrolase [Phycisphaerae bacterium]